MISLCQRCCDVLKVDLKDNCGLSHGLCEHCQPIYLRENGVPEEDIKELMDKRRIK